MTETRDATSKLANDIRDKDLNDPVGFGNQAQCKREFVAGTGLQSAILRMAAERVAMTVDSENWKSFERGWPTGTVGTYLTVSDEGYWKAGQGLVRDRKDLKSN